MDDSNALKEYRKVNSLKLINEYRDLIEKTFTVVDKDLLQDKIDKKGDDNETEQKYLEAIKKRRVALDEVDLMLDKIEKLERHVNPEIAMEEKKDIQTRSWTKKAAEATKK